MKFVLWTIKNKNENKKIISLLTSAKKWAIPLEGTCITNIEMTCTMLRDTLIAFGAEKVLVFDINLRNTNWSALLDKNVNKWLKEQSL